MAACKPVDEARMPSERGISTAWVGASWPSLWQVAYEPGFSHVQNIVTTVASLYMAIRVDELCSRAWLTLSTHYDKFMAQAFCVANLQAQLMLSHPVQPDYREACN